MMNKKVISSLVFGVFFLASFTNIGSSKVAQAANLGQIENIALIRTLDSFNQPILPLSTSASYDRYRSVLDSIAGDWYNDDGDLIARINRDKIVIDQTRLGGNVLSAHDFAGAKNIGVGTFDVDGGRTSVGARVGVIRVKIEWHINQPDGEKDYIIINDGEVLH